MTLEEIFNAIKNKLDVATNFAQVAAFCGDTRANILRACADEGACVCVSFDAADVASSNASYRIKPQSRAFTVYYACSLARMEGGAHLADIEQIFSTLHAFRVGNDTLQPVDAKIVDRDSVIVYALSFTI